MVEIGNFFYFLPIVLLFAIFALCIFLVKKFGKRFASILIQVLLWFNFAQHFLKQFFPYIMVDWPSSIQLSTSSNLCALYVIAAPFIFYFGSKYLKDAMFYFGFIFALAAYLMPTTPTDPATYELDLWWLENCRYYICHLPIFICGPLMVISNLHKLDYHRILVMPFIFVACQGIVYINDCILAAVGWIGDGYVTDWNSFIEFMTNRELYANAGGSIGFPLWSDSVFKYLYPIFIPYLMVYYPDGSVHFLQAYDPEAFGVAIRFTPVIYMLIPSMIAFYLFLPLMALPFEHRHMKIDHVAHKQKVSMRKALKQR